MSAYTKSLDVFFSLPSWKRVLIGIVSSIFISYTVYIGLIQFAAVITGISYGDFLYQTKLATQTLDSRFFIQYMLFVQGITFFLIPAIIMMHVLSKDLNLVWYFQNTISKKLLVGVFLFICINIPGINFWSSVNTLFVAKIIEKHSPLHDLYMHNEAITDFLLSSPYFFNALLNIVLIGIVPAVCEEFFFRGMIQKYVYRITLNNHVSIIATAILFSLMHGDVFNFVPRFIMGIVFGYLYLYGKTLWVPIFAHFVHNSMIVLAFYFMHNNYLPSDFDTWGGFSNSWQVGIISILISSLLFYGFVKRNVMLSDRKN